MNALRWIGVLPGALVAGLLSTIPLHLVLFQTLSKFVDPYPQTPERLLTPFCVWGVTVWVGSRIAPASRAVTAWVLWVCAVLIVVLFKVAVPEMETAAQRALVDRVAQPGGLPAVALQVTAIAGACAGLLVALRQAGRRSQAPPEPAPTGGDASQVVLPR